MPIRQPMLERNNAYRSSHIDASQPRRVWNYGLIAALLFNALLWAGIWWAVGTLFY
ncbi:hypothetical protein GPL17_27305 [Bradyrhizobium yuanmingense]|uniref:hypothetical protein n=1 Tax=Bradyrhizobium yuanmingense TaxID=108015 RepID=UPI0012FB30E2|nr:hypothetical protein [Bradyrhizobium yuanmingense]MVT54174.1 hypothetical protein [Bradyrhizobium yuanmingense]